MFFSNILHILCNLNFNNTMNCISHNDRLADCVLKIVPYFRVHGHSKCETKSVKVVTILD